MADDKISKGVSAKPTLYYLDIGSLGRGEVVRLFLKDAAIDFEDIRYTYDDTWKATSGTLESQGLTLTGKLPTLDYKGHLLTQHLAILRYLARELGEYDGESSYDKYLVDCVADIYNDWRSEWLKNISGPSNEYRNVSIPKFHKILSNYYSRDSSGPYLLGNRITYVDFAVFQAIDNDKVIGALTTEFPTPLAKLKDALQARPRVMAYLAAGRKG